MSGLTTHLLYDSKGITRSVAAIATAPSARFAYLRVFLVVGVSLWAMCSGQHPLASVSTPNVFQVRDGLSVVGVYAASDAAEMIWFQFKGHGSTCEDPSGTSGVYKLPANGKAPISVFIKETHPDPAASFGDDLDVAHKAFDIGFEGKLIVSHVTPFKSHRSGSRGASNAFAGRSYSSAAAVLG